jgi:hypothetical protein
MEKWIWNWIYGAILGFCMVAMAMQHGGTKTPEDCGAACTQSQNGG